MEALEDLELDDPAEPAHPDPRNQMAVELWKVDIKEHWQMVQEFIYIYSNIFILSFFSLNHTHGSALQGLKMSCSMMSWILCDCLKPELFKPCRAKWVTGICPCSSSNSAPATMYSFSFVWLLGKHCQCLLP